MSEKVPNLTVLKDAARSSDSFSELAKYFNVNPKTIYLKNPEKKVSKLSPPGEKKKEHPKCETTRYALFYTDIFTGMRRGELLGLKWEDIDWINRKIHVRRTLYKGSFQTPKSKYSKRDIDMGPRLTDVLKNHRAKQNEPRLKVGEG